MNKPFEDNEKRYILAEMIKASQIDVVAVVDFIKTYSILPNWMDMHYPNGRTPNECKQVAEGMGIASTAPPLFQFSFPQQQQQQQQQQLPPQPYLLAHFPEKRKYSNESAESAPKRLAAGAAPDSPAPRPRVVNIQPRPAPNGSPPTGPPTASVMNTSAAAPAPRNPSRRRGRPSKADREAQARASGAMGTSHPLLAPAPRQLAVATAGSPPSVDTLLESASACAAGSAKARSITPRPTRDASHDSEESPRKDAAQSPNATDPAASRVAVANLLKAEIKAS